jgi:alkylation response protein AidB-like acyl-CoA dehydrogenase
MMEMVNGSRFGVALMGLGIHRRSFLEAAIYAGRRSQFGQRIDRYPLVRETLVDMAVDLEAGLGGIFECASAMRTAPDPESGRLVRRILIPLAKLRCTRIALQQATTALEVFGGNGYMEDWPMARQLRDAQCHTIWEGTENILCIDVRRAMRGEQAHVALLARVERALDAASGVGVLAGPRDTVAATLKDTRTAIAHLEKVDDDLGLLHSRRLAELLADLTEGALLVEHAAWSLERDGDARKALVARRFCTRRLASPPVRGMLDEDRSVIDFFEPLVRYGRIEASDLAA